MCQRGSGCPDLHKCAAVLRTGWRGRAASGDPTGCSSGRGLIGTTGASIAVWWPALHFRTAYIRNKITFCGRLSQRPGKEPIAARTRLACRAPRHRNCNGKQAIALLSMVPIFLSFLPFPMMTLPTLAGGWRMVGAHCPGFASMWRAGSAAEVEVCHLSSSTVSDSYHSASD